MQIFLGCCCDIMTYLYSLCVCLTFERLGFWAYGGDGSPCDGQQLKLSRVFGFSFLFFQIYSSCNSAAYCWSPLLTATLGLSFQATWLQGNYLLQGRQRQIK